MTERENYLPIKKKLHREVKSNNWEKKQNSLLKNSVLLIIIIVIVHYNPSNYNHTLSRRARIKDTVKKYMKSILVNY